MTQIDDTAAERHDLWRRWPSRHRRMPLVGGAILRVCSSRKGLRSDTDARRTQQSRRCSFILVPVLALAGLPGVARGSILEDPNLWAAGYNGPANADDYAGSLATAPDGSKVFVTGSSAGSGTRDYATVAYSTATGAQLWVARYNSANSFDNASSLAVAPDGSKVFVTGTIWDSRATALSSRYDYATVAYSTATGAQLWAARYNGPTKPMSCLSHSINNQDAHCSPSDDYASSLAVAPDGSKVFVTGLSSSGDSYDYATVAYSTATSCANGKDEIGPASGPVSKVEPLAGPTAAPYVHRVNCNVVAANGL